MSVSLNSSRGQPSALEIQNMIKVAASQTQLLDLKLFHTFIQIEMEVNLLEKEAGDLPELKEACDKAMVDYVRALFSLFHKTHVESSTPDPIYITREVNRINRERIAYLGNCLQSVKKTSEVVKQCAACKRTEEETPLQLCGRCKLLRYCSIDCQKSDWLRHKTAECTPHS